MDDSFREVDGAGTEDNGAQPTGELIAENPDMDAATKNLVQRAVKTETTLDHESVARDRTLDLTLSLKNASRVLTLQVARTGNFTTFTMLSCLPVTGSSRRISIRNHTLKPTHQTCCSRKVKTFCSEKGIHRRAQETR